VPQIALTLDLDGLDAETVEAACFEAGALAVTYSDQRDDPVLEPAPGEVRLWPATRLQALFDADDLPPAQLVFLAADIGCDVGRLQVRAVEDKVWEREWLRDFTPMRFGERLWIQPSHMKVDAPDAVIVELDPGLAFGTGTHPTTRLCLEYLDAAAHTDGGLAGLRVVDYGCGSGVLAVAALKLGAAEALVHDIDPQALTATRDNADRNGVADRLQVYATQEDLAAAVADGHSRSSDGDDGGNGAHGGADIVLANILAGPLRELAPQLCALLKPGGTLVLAGLLDEQAEELIEAYGADPALVRWRSLEGWTCLVGTTRAPTPVDLSPPAPAAAPRGTGALLALLALLLAGQLAWHGRATLAGLPPIGAAVKDIAAALGRPVQPDWDPRLYEVVQQGASEGDAPGFLTVRATLRNTAAVPQPAPLLRLVLIDAQGRTVARRDLLPAEYAPAATPTATTAATTARAPTLLAPGARLSAEFSAQDPGARVVGFELDACLPRADRAPVCAHGAIP
jgi:ribosomal protein L11 methyltransferase